MQTIATRYGIIPASSVVETWPDGSPRAVRACAPCVLHTPLGRLVPQHATDDLRKKEVQPVGFHPNGTLKHLPLETQTTVATPAGDISAEMLTFHPDGSLSRVFPLNGKLSGYWSQEDEAGLAAPTTLRTPAGPITTTVIGVAFHPSGALRSLTLWPGETVTVDTPAGTIAARMGVAFRPDGSIRSVEPAVPTPVDTPAGMITAHDPDAVGINGDDNSLTFHPDGSVARVATVLTRLTATGPDGRSTAFAPGQRDSLCGDTARETVPMIVEFTPREVVVRLAPGEPATRLALASHTFMATPWLRQFANPMGSLRCSV
jgi:hypothetical protein